MITILSALVSLLSFRFRSRASLELELVALRHQLIVFARGPAPPPWAPPPRPTPVGVGVPSAAADPRKLGAHQASDRGQMAPQRLSDLLAVAITLSRAPQD